MRTKRNPELDLISKNAGAAMQSCGKGMADGAAVSTQRSVFSSVTLLGTRRKLLREPEKAEEIKIW
jgi:hypothetical protein